MPKNLTLSIDDDLLAKARVLAAMKRTSVNEMVRGFLQRAVAEETEADATTEELMRLVRAGNGEMGAWRPSRAETYSGLPRFDRWR